jgi:hypothetical protein
MKIVTRVINAGVMTNQKIGNTQVSIPVKMPASTWSTISQDGQRITQTCEIADALANYYLNKQREIDSAEAHCRTRIGDDSDD